MHPAACAMAALAAYDSNCDNVLTLAGCHDCILVAPTAAARLLCWPHALNSCVPVLKWSLDTAMPGHSRNVLQKCFCMDAAPLLFCGTSRMD